MTFSLKEILILFTVFQLIIFSILLIARIKVLQSNLIFLGMFFLSLAINISNYFLILKSFYLINTPYLIFLYLGSPFAFSYAPLFYLYLKAITLTRFKPELRTLLHFIPFTLHLTYILCFFTILPISEKKEIILHGGFYSIQVYHGLTILLHLQVLVYSLLGVLQILNVRRRLKNLYSSVEKLNFSWISSMLAAILCLWFLDLSRFFSAYFSKAFSNVIETALFLGFVLFCYFFLYKALTFRLLIEENDLQAVSKKFSLSSSLRIKYQQQLMRYMMEQKPFLDPEITLVELAQQVDIPPRSLSEVINNSFQQNFYDFINSYRIKESEVLFKSNKHKKTILEVLYEVGFNSKSSFNTAFKKLTGMTPTEYRRHYRFSEEPQKKAG